MSYLEGTDILGADVFEELREADRRRQKQAEVDARKNLVSGAVDFAKRNWKYGLLGLGAVGVLMLLIDPVDPHAKFRFPDEPAAEKKRSGRAKRTTKRELVERWSTEAVDSVRRGLISARKAKLKLKRARSSKKRVRA